MKRFNIRCNLYPDEHQANAIKQHMGYVRYVWNHYASIAEQWASHQTGQLTYPVFDELVANNAEFLKDAIRPSIEHTMSTFIETNYQSRAPAFKRKRDKHQMFFVPGSCATIDFDTLLISLGHIKDITVELHCQKPKYATLDNVLVEMENNKFFAKLMMHSYTVKKVKS